MHALSALGPAEVSPARLTGLVADLLGHPAHEVEVLSSAVEPVDYDVPALTTVGRHWVHGRARTPGGVEPYRMFVKHVQAWHHSALFSSAMGGAPAPVREHAARSVPWRTEPLVYRSALAGALPRGLSMPRALGVFDVEPDAAVLWLEPVASAAEPVEWDPERRTRAAYLLGRLAASPQVAPYGDIGSFTWSVLDYVHGRLAAQVLPVLASDELWHHALVAGAFDDALRDRLRAAARSAVAAREELAALPRLRAHGDATPGNLLPGPTPDSFVLIDFGFWLPQPVGFNLGQLVGGDVQLGDRTAADLAQTDDACVTAYVAGLAAEGCDLPVALVRRAHALQLLLFVGLSAVPLDLLDLAPTPALLGLARERAALARHSVDLVEATH